VTENVNDRPVTPRLTLSRPEAAAALGVSVDFLDEHVLHGLRVVRVGRRKLIPIKELERWIADNAALALHDERQCL
jgi:excisionase family DNA binding protein